MADNITRYSGAGSFANDSNYEVQRSNHFEIQIDFSSFNDFAGINKNNIQQADEMSKTIRLCCTSAPIPTINIQTQPLRHGNETVNVAGSPSWGTMSVGIYDVIGRNVAKLLQTWFHNVFNPYTHVMGMVKNYKTTATVFQYSPDASIIRKWVCYGVFPTSLNFGSYSADGQGQPVIIQMELSVDKSILYDGKEAAQSYSQAYGI